MLTARGAIGHQPKVPIRPPVSRSAGPRIGERRRLRPRQPVRERHGRGVLRRELGAVDGPRDRRGPGRPSGSRPRWPGCRRRCRSTRSPSRPTGPQNPRANDGGAQTSSGLVRRRLERHGPAQRGRPGPDVDGDHERPTGDDAHQLALRRVPLEVQAAHDAPRRAGLVDLLETRRAARARANAFAWTISANQPRSSPKRRGRTTTTSGIEVGSRVNGTATSSPGRRRRRAPGR